MKHLCPIHILKLIKFKSSWFTSRALMQSTLPPTNHTNHVLLQFILKKEILQILNNLYLVGKIKNKKESI